MAVLAAEGIDTRNYFDPPVHRQQAYQGRGALDLPTTEAVSRSVVSLPIYPDLSVDDVDVVKVIRLSHEHADELVAFSARAAARHSSAAPVGGGPPRRGNPPTPGARGFGKIAPRGRGGGGLGCALGSGRRRCS